MDFTVFKYEIEAEKRSHLHNLCTRAVNMRRMNYEAEYLQKMGRHIKRWN